MSVWRINGTTTEELKVSNLRISYASAEEDKASFIEDGPDFDGSPLFSYLQSVAISKDGTPVFQGVITDIKPSGSGNAESKEYSVSGPWYYFKHTIFLQEWKVWENDVEVTAWKSRGILGSDTAMGRINTGRVIEEAASIARNSDGSRFSIGAIDVGTHSLWDQSLDESCAEVIHKMLRWAPDAVCWFDYSGGTPIFHCRRRFVLNATTINLDNGWIDSCSVLPRYDLQIPGVVIRYERTDIFDEKERDIIQYDVYPPTAEPTDLKVVNMTVGLQGAVTSLQRQHIKVEELPEEPTPTNGADNLNTAKDWWRKHLPWLAKVEDDDLLISGSERLGEEKYPNELIQGNIQEWMQVNVEEEVIRARISYKIKDGDTILSEGTNIEVAVNIIATDGISLTYKKAVPEEEAEEAPTGLAEGFYNAAHPLQYEGQLIITEDEVQDFDYMGKRLNLSSGKSEWQTMAAMINALDIDIDTGTTAIQYGPPPHLNLADFLEYHRMNRNKIEIRRGSNRSTSEYSASGEVEHGGQSPLQNGANEPGGGDSYVGWKCIINPEYAQKLDIGTGFGRAGTLWTLDMARTFDDFDDAIDGDGYSYVCVKFDFTANLQNNSNTGWDIVALDHKPFENGVAGADEEGEKSFERYEVLCKVKFDDGGEIIDVDQWWRGGKVIKDTTF